jgi:tetratricopeptide (TPR) repeat protein
MAQFIGGHVIITSRLSNFAAEIEPLELDVLSIDDAATFLLERTKGRRRLNPDDEEKARKLAKELDGLALALEQAGAYIAARRLTFEQYLKQWRENQDKVMAWYDEAVMHYPRAVAVTWQTSVAQLTPAGRLLLERLAWLASEPIPEFLLDVPCPGEDENLVEAFADLAAYSLITRDAEGPFFLIHRLVQDVTRRSLTIEARTRSLSEALNWINTAFAGDPGDVRNWPQLEPLVPHGQSIASFADAAEIPEPTARLMNQIAGLLQTKALHAEAEPLLRRSLAIDEKKYGSDHFNVAIRLNNLAETLIDTNRLTEAEPLVRRSLAIVEKTQPPDSPAVATGLNNLAHLLQERKRNVEAEPLLRRSLAIVESQFGPDDPRITSALNNLGRLLIATNRTTEAEALVRRALAIDEKGLGPCHPTVANRLNNLAGLLSATNRHAEAETLIRRALAIDENSFGAEHPDVANRLNNLTAFLGATNRWVEAEPLMRRSLTILIGFRRRTGHQHPYFGLVLENYASVLKNTGKSDAEIKSTIQALMASG